LNTKNALSPLLTKHPGYAHWILALCIASGSLFWSWHRLDDGPNEHRRDGNRGHATIDFAGPYLLGHMVLNGHGEALYDRHEERGVLRRLYPTSDEDPQQERTDAERLMAWLLGRDDPTEVEKISTSILAIGAGQPLVLLARAAIMMPARPAQASSSKCLGGPLYPPLAGLLYAPLSLWQPHIAYRLAQIGNLFWSLCAAIAIWQLSERTYSLPFVWCLLLLFPGCINSITLGQNAAFSLSLLAWGWLLAKAGHNRSAGILWGVLTYKPVWLLAFFPVPILSRRWAMAAAMAASSGFLVLLTLPSVGTQSWINWLQLTLEAFTTYSYDPTWIRGSRDLLSLPRQCNLVAAPSWTDSSLAISGWSLLGVVVLTTLAVAICRRKSMAGPTADGFCFVLLAAWLSCIHFMHYDVLLAALPVLILSSRPHYRWPRIILAFLATCLLVTPGAPGWSGMAWETIALLVLWIWCGWRIWTDGSAPKCLQGFTETKTVLRELAATATA
jgi:hypothetical protein